MEQEILKYKIRKRQFTIGFSISGVNPKQLVSIKKLDYTTW